MKRERTNISSERTETRGEVKRESRWEEREIKQINSEALAKRNVGWDRRRQPFLPSLHLILSLRLFTLFALFSFAIPVAI